MLRYMFQQSVIVLIQFPDDGLKSGHNIYPLRKIFNARELSPTCWTFGISFFKNCSSGLNMPLFKPCGWKEKKFTEVPTGIFYSSGSSSRFWMFSGTN